MSKNIPKNTTTINIIIAGTMFKFVIPFCEINDIIPDNFTIIKNYTQCSQYIKENKKCFILYKERFQDIYCKQNVQALNNLLSRLHLLRLKQPVRFLLFQKSG